MVHSGGDSGSACGGTSGGERWMRGGAYDGTRGSVFMVCSLASVEVVMDVSSSKRSADPSATKAHGVSMAKATTATAAATSTELPSS